MNLKKYSLFVKRFLLTVAAGLVVGLANAADTIKVGVLHSLSGTLAISETTLNDVVLMLVDEQIRKVVCWASN